MTDNLNDLQIGYLVELPFVGVKRVDERRYPDVEHCPCVKGGSKVAEMRTFNVDNPVTELTCALNLTSYVAHGIDDTNHALRQFDGPDLDQIERLQPLNRSIKLGFGVRKKKSVFIRPGVEVDSHGFALANSLLEQCSHECVASFGRDLLLRGGVRNLHLALPLGDPVGTENSSDRANRLHPTRHQAGVIGSRSRRRRAEVSDQDDCDDPRKNVENGLPIFHV